MPLLESFIFQAQQLQGGGLTTVLTLGWGSSQRQSRAKDCFDRCVGADPGEIDSLALLQQERELFSLEACACFGVFQTLPVDEGGHSFPPPPVFLVTRFAEFPLVKHLISRPFKSFQAFGYFSQLLLHRPGFHVLL